MLGLLGLPEESAAHVVPGVFDVVALLLALLAAAECAVIGFDRVELPTVDGFGRASGAIWQQVLPALYVYGAFTVVLVLAMLLRHLVWGRKRLP